MGTDTAKRREKDFIAPVIPQSSLRYNVQMQTIYCHAQHWKSYTIVTHYRRSKWTAHAGRVALDIQSHSTVRSKGCRDCAKQIDAPMIFALTHFVNVHDIRI